MVFSTFSITMKSWRRGHLLVYKLQRRVCIRGAFDCDPPPGETVVCRALLSVCPGYMFCVFGVCCVEDSTQRGKWATFYRVRLCVLNGQGRPTFSTAEVLKFLLKCISLENELIFKALSLAFGG